MREIIWEFSRGYRRHDGFIRGHDLVFRIHNCTPYLARNNPKLGFDLFINHEFIAHGKTAKELKAVALSKAEELLGNPK